MAGQKKLVGTVKDFNSKRGFGAAPANIAQPAPTIHEFSGMSAAAKPTGFLRCGIES